MPTQPFEPILNRDLKLLPKVIPEILSPTLQEAINYATQFYQRCEISKEFKPDETYPILASYLHIVQMTDGIEILISNGCVEPANLLLRSLFEAKLAVTYMLEKDTKQRAVSWMTKIIIDRIEYYKNIELPNPESDKIANTPEQSIIDAIINPLPISDIPDIVSKLEENLKKPGYAEAFAEHTALIKKKRRYPEWYSYFNGPKNLKELAVHCNQGPIYKTLYSSWSKMSHVSDAAHLTFLLENGTSFLGPIRNPMNSVETGTFALSMLLEATQAIYRKFRRYESSRFEKWYAKEISGRHIMLVRFELDHLKWIEQKFIKKEKQS